MEPARRPCGRCRGGSSGSGVLGDGTLAGRTPRGAAKFCDEEVTPLFAESSWSEIALVSIAAGVGEEMLFRGFLQASFCAWLGTPWGLTISSILFGLLDPISIIYVVIAGLIGFYLGAIWILNGHLLTVMVTHAVYDFAALGYLIRIRAGEGLKSDVGLAPRSLS